MTILNILTYPERILSKPAKTIENIDEQLDMLMKDMTQTMFAAPGLGLAAVQVGEDRQLLVYDADPESDRRIVQVLINPRIIEHEGTIVSENEGCLSVPDLRVNIKRHASILVEATDGQGNPIRLEQHGLSAIIIQHEMDHLNGKLLIDHISALKRNLYTKRIKKRLNRK